MTNLKMPSLKKLLWRIIAALSLMMLLSSAYLFLPQTFFSLDNRLRDFLFLLRGPIPASSDIVIIDIDDKSLKAEGQWPWSRNKVAELIKNLSEAEAGIIGLDIVFSEADKSSPHAVAADLQCAQKDLENYDTILAEAVASTPTIGGYFFTFEKSELSRAPFIPAIFIEKGGSSQEYIITPDNLVLNIPAIQDAFYSSGFFNNTPDEGGMIRRVPLLMRYKGTLYPSLSLEMIRIFSAAKRVIVTNSVTGVETITMGNLQIPTDRFARLMVNFRGESRSFDYISATDILSKNFNSEDVAGKFVLLGTSAVGLADLRATPFDTVMPGVEVHANVIDNLLHQDFIALPENTVLLDLLLIVTTVALVITLLSLLNVWFILPLFIATLYGLYLFYMEMLFSQGLVLNILFPSAALVLSFMAALLLDYIINLRQKQLVMAVFAKKVSKDVMNDLIENSSDTLLTPRNKEVTVFFSDIRSFTEISEKLADPERVITMLNTYMTPMVETVTRHQGTVDKFIGDAVMAYWNAPTEIQNHADKAVTAALQQLRLLNKLNLKLKERFDIQIDIGIGIHTGEVTIGEMGSIGRSDYTIIGDNVNLASRLEGLTKIYGVSLIISSQTKSQLTLDFQTRALDIVKVKGKEEAVEIFEVFGQDKEVSSDEMRRYESALSFYRAKKIEEALGAFESLQQDFASPLYELYIERCQHAIDVGVGTFDTVTTMHTK
ncbi:MAG: adenylate/guanylate cyclase domain-containing protein [Campylobacterota bacterium]